MSIKKINIQNPVDIAAQFISSVQDGLEGDKPSTDQNAVLEEPVPVRDRPKTAKDGRELKRKRYNLLLIPSTYGDIEKIAYVEKISVNEAVNRALAMYREAKKDILTKYAVIEKL
jgi:hypothetical protein